MKNGLISGAAMALVMLVPSGAAAEDAQADYAAPQDELVEARAIMEMIFPLAERDQIFMKIVGDIGGQLGESMFKGPIFEEPGIKAIMDEFLAELPTSLLPLIQEYMPGIIDATAVAYTREFTLKELQDIRAFANTPSGSRYFRLSTTLLSDPAVAAANKKYFAALGLLQAEKTRFLQAEVEEYLLANPEAMERLSGKMIAESLQ